MELLPLKENLEDNTEFLDHPDCKESLPMSIKFFKKVGYHPPWIGYYAQVDGELVGSGAFKGRPFRGKVEIAYGAFPQFRKKGVGSEICKELVQLALKTNPAIRITARTLPVESFSTKILRKNSFQSQGTVIDDDDGEVWEWEYIPRATHGFTPR